MRPKWQNWHGKHDYKILREKKEKTQRNNNVDTIIQLWLGPELVITNTKLKTRKFITKE